MQVWPQVQSEAGNRLTRVLQEKALVIANTFFQQSKGRLYTWTLQKGQHWNQIDYIPCSQRWRSSIQSAKIRHGPVCGSDNQLLNAKYRLKLKKVGKTTRQFRYQFSSVAVMSDSKGPHGLQHASPPCPSPTARAYSNSCPPSQLCQATTSSCVIPFSSRLQSFPAWGSFPMS